MVKETGTGNTVVESQTTHRCSLSCLGPLTFHPRAVGSEVTLSKGCQHAERTKTTFKNGLVFSSRPLKVQERIRLRVEKDLFNWNGGLRVGFTNVSPSARSLPLPTMAIPNLTERPGHWAGPVGESFTQVGSELEFWVSNGGTVYVSGNNNSQRKLLTGVDLSQPLWAMIDIYGQTCSVSLLGSKKRGLLGTKRSCPAPERLTTPEHDNIKIFPDEDTGESYHDMTIPSDMECVVCLGGEARVTLPCGHRCLCRQCASRVAQEFGVCPLCRQPFR